MRSSYAIFIGALTLFVLIWAVSCSEYTYQQNDPNRVVEAPRIGTFSVNGMAGTFETNNSRYYITVVLNGRSSSGGESSEESGGSESSEEAPGGSPARMQGGAQPARRVGSSPTDGLVAVFTTTAGADVWVGTVRQISGQTANDFPSPNRLKYVVRAADGTLTAYHVGVYENESDVPPFGSGGGGASGSAASGNGISYAFDGGDFTGTGDVPVNAASASYISGFSRTTGGVRKYVSVDTGIGAGPPAGTCMRIAGTAASNTTAAALYIAQNPMNDPEENTMLTFWVKGSAPSGLGIILDLAGTIGTNGGAPGVALNGLDDPSYTFQTSGTFSWGTPVSVPEWKKVRINFGSVNPSLFADRPFQIRSRGIQAPEAARAVDLYFDEFRYEDGSDDDGSSSAPSSSGGGASSGGTSSASSGGGASSSSSVDLTGLLVFAGADFEDGAEGIAGSASGGALAERVTPGFYETDGCLYISATGLTATTTVYISSVLVNDSGTDAYLTFWIKGSAPRGISVLFGTGDTVGGLSTQNVGFNVGANSGVEVSSGEVTGNFGGSPSNAGSINTGENWVKCKGTLASNATSGIKNSNFSGLGDKKLHIRFGANASSQVFNLYFDEFRYEP